MTASLTEIHARLRAADRALALATGGSSELAHVREAVGSLLVAVHELARLHEQELPAAGRAHPEEQTPAAPPRRHRP